MSTRSRLSRVMLIKINQGRHVRIILPLALWVIDELVEGFEDWIWFFQRLFPTWSRKLTGWRFQHDMEQMTGQNLPVTSIVKHLQELLYELRKQGRWKLAEVDVEDVRVKVEFF